MHLQVIALASVLLAADLDEFKVKREGPETPHAFEFAQKPLVTRDGDRVTVSFETKGFCDATVAIEDGRGRIVRHLAAGVLGPSAPEPFLKGSKKQTVTWDGKNDKGEYVDEVAKLSVRVSLGLRARFEKDLIWEPRRRITWRTLLMRAAPEGVYVFDSRGHEHLRLFDHQGNYVRTVYPFAAGDLGKVKGLTWAEFPQDGKRLPLRLGPARNTFLTAGDHRWSSDLEYWGAKEAIGATAMDVRGGWITLAMQRLNRLPTQSGADTADLTGPPVAFALDPATKTFFCADDADKDKMDLEKTPLFIPEDGALSPDGKWLYLTGYHRRRRLGQLAWAHEFLDCVVRVPVDGSAKPDVFAGKMGIETKGSGPGEFSLPRSVAVDETGRVYVADYANDRVQVLGPDGKHLRYLVAKRPAVVRVHRKTGQVYVFSWDVDTRLLPEKPLVEPTLTIFEPLDKGAGMASYPFPYCLTMNNWGDGSRTQYQVFYSVEVDSWADPPTIWLSTERTIGYGPGTSQGYENLQRKPFETIGVRLLQLKDGRWTEVLDFGRETKRSIGIADPAKHGVEHLVVNAEDGTLYDALYGAPLLRIDPESGAIAEIKGPPGGPGDLFTIGPDGFLYSVYEGGWLVRWDPATNREVPFDYGTEIPEADGKPVAKSALRLPGGHLIEFHGHWPGVSVGEDGRIACFTWSVGQQVIHQGDSFFRKEVREFAPTVYPGRSIDYLVSVWDRYGKPISQDALPGIGMLAGLAVDREGKITALSTDCRLIDGKPFFLKDTCTLVKFDPKRTRILTSARAPVPLVLKSGFNTLERKVGGREVPTALDAPPARPQDVEGYWLEGAEWCYGGVGFMSRSMGQNECWCLSSNFALDRLRRSFVPETSHYTVAVLDSNGNLILRIGRYGNEEDGMPLVKSRCPPNPRSIGGDEVALCQPLMVGVHTDRRLFVSDPGNARLISVKLDYHAAESIPLRDVPATRP